MPTRARSVSFETAPVFSRQPYDDEKYVMKAFSRHCGRCSQCSNPYAVHKAGGTLCDKGHRRALDVAQYVYSQSGVSYSLVDRECHEHIQLEIPVGCDAVRSLLKAMERGLRLMRAPHADLPSRASSVHSDSSASRSGSASEASSRSSSASRSPAPAPRRASSQRNPPPVSYDRSYYVAPRVTASSSSASSASSSSKPERRESHRSAERRHERHEKSDKASDDGSRRHRRHRRSSRDSDDDYEPRPEPRSVTRRDRASTYSQPSRSGRKYYDHEAPPNYYPLPVRAH